MKNAPYIRIGLIALACGSCSSAPVHYYTLMQPLAVADGGDATGCCSVEIRRVRIPAEVDRPELVARRSDDELTLLGNDRWLAPLNEEIRGALVSEIERRLKAAAPIQALPPAQRYIVFVDVDRFESVPARYVLVQADWRIDSTSLPKQPALTCQATAKIEVQSGVAAMVQGHQQALVKIADQIALNLLDAEPLTARHCPTNL